MNPIDIIKIRPIKPNAENKQFKYNKNTCVQLSTRKPNYNILAEEILATAIAPTWDEIGKLAAIASLRTALNYFLERELKHNEGTLSIQPTQKIKSE